MKIPDELAPLFQNYDLPSMDMVRFADLIIRTALTRGTLPQIDLLFQLYGAAKIKEVFCSDFFGLRTLPVSTTLLWSLLFLTEEERREYIRWYKDPCQRWAPRRTVLGEPYRQPGKPLFGGDFAPGSAPAKLPE
ncbi:MAG: hypothetical protein GX883_00765 [Firmicutes bacterium]|nr:hypothetical protein [Bacillota bacterium]